LLETLRLLPSRLPDEKRSEYRADDWTAKDYLDEFLPKIKERSTIWDARCVMRTGRFGDFQLEGVLRRSSEMNYEVADSLQYLRPFRLT
jgi:hypothetical protein